MGTLDTDLKQVLVYYEEDPNGLLYHHRLLVVPGPAGKWVGLTPTHDIQVFDLAELASQITPLRRAAPFPTAIPANEIFAFDPLDRGVEDRLRDECYEFASLLGYVPSSAPPARLGRWLVADTASDLFGEEVPDAALADPDLAIVRGDCGLANVGGAWVLMQRVAEGREEAWRLEKWTGQGRDPRIAGNKVDPQGRRYMSEVDSMVFWRPPKSQPKDNPLQGPSAALEFFEGLRVAGHTLAAHDQQWRQRSGVPDSGLAARFHTAMSEVLRYLVTVDQLDPTNCISAELATRYLVMVETAVDRNPKQPDWDGLESLVSSALSAKGAVELPRFSNWVSGVQKDRAVILKQGRLLREERAAEAKRRGGAAQKESQA